MDNKEKNDAAAMAPIPPVAFTVPAETMDLILRYIGRGPWLDVNELMNYIRQTSVPMYKPVEDEKENKKPSGK